jgi:uncharacterized protein
MEPPGLEILLFLTTLAGLAGFVDAIAGGGGLITLPALLIAGVAPTDAIATNKLQGTFGVATASARYWHAGLIDLHSLATAIAATAAGAAAGSLLVSNVDTVVLHRIMPFALIAAALYFAATPYLREYAPHASLSTGAFALGAAAPVGFYDGIFGPGAGSLYTLAFLALAGCNLITATANAKILNFMSNLASLGIFLVSGHVNFAIGLSMAAGQIIGAWVGSHTALKHGTWIIRPLLVATTSAVAIKLLMGS